YLDGTAVFVHRSGAGPTLVLVHGFLMSHWYFRAIIDQLAREYDVVALDLPGAGESDRPAPAVFDYGIQALAATLIRLLDRLEIAHAALLGHSLGGGVAIAAAARAPQRFWALIPVDAAAYPLVLPRAAQLALDFGVGELLFKRAYTKPLFARDL